MRTLKEGQVSTDYSYSVCSAETINNVGEALGFSDAKYVTTETLQPQRLLYHCILAAIHINLKLTRPSEEYRSGEIARMADEIYALVVERFNQALDESVTPEQGQKLSDKLADLEKFYDRFPGEDSGCWDRDGFNSKWSEKADRKPWRNVAIKAYRDVMDRISDGDYEPVNGWDALKVSKFWAQQTLSSAHYKYIAYALINEQIGRLIQAGINKIDYYQTAEREAVIIFGGIGSGKSVTTEAYLETLPMIVEGKQRFRERYNRIIHNADFLKVALADTARRDGVLSFYTGAEVQRESSNALYEAVVKLSALATRHDMGPNLVINSIVAGAPEISQILEGGGHAQLHYISMDPEIANVATFGRSERQATSGDVHISCQAAARSLLNNVISRKSAKMTTFMYEREEARGNLNHIATVDSKNLAVEVYDIDAFIRVGERCNFQDKEIGEMTEDDKKSSARIFIQSILNQGFAISVVTKDQDRDLLYTLLASSKLDIVDGKSDLVHPLIREIALETQMGNFVLRQKANLEGVLAGR